ncbi:UNVERIFIED_CONTAM: hypothetical protein GTU68_015720 [Idotea baltica]|nr:hypothetical protein [Idotea baltica]
MPQWTLGLSGHWRIWITLYLPSRIMLLSMSCI